MADERYMSLYDEEEYYEPEDYYPEDDFDKEFVEDELEDECDRLLEVIDRVRRSYDLHEVDNIILDLLEEVINLL